MPVGIFSIAFFKIGFFKKMKKQLSFTKDKKEKTEEEVQLRATGRGGKGNRVTQLYIGAVDRSRSSSQSSAQTIQPRRSFNRSGFKVDKDEIKKAYHDVRSDKTGINTYERL